jgi:hypothetical protein
VIDAYLTRNSPPTEARQVTATDSSGNKVAIDTAIRGADGEPFSLTNPLPVAPVSSLPSGSTAVRDRQEEVNLAANTAIDHNYLMAADTNIRAIHASASGLIRAEIFTTPDLLAYTSIGFVSFNQTGSNILIKPEVDLVVPTGEYLVVRLLNREASPQNVYSTVEGYTV